MLTQLYLLWILTSLKRAFSQKLLAKIFTTNSFVEVL
jgi:hypothetical protein